MKCQIIRLYFSVIICSHCVRRRIRWEMILSCCNMNDDFIFYKLWHLSEQALRTVTSCSSANHNSFLCFINSSWSSFWNVLVCWLDSRIKQKLLHHSDQSSLTFSADPEKETDPRSLLTFLNIFLCESGEFLPDLLKMWWLREKSFLIMNDNLYAGFWS